MKFALNRRTLQFEPQVRERPSAEEIFRETKRKRYDLIRAHNITDEEIKDLINQVMRGTRNTMYLARGENYTRFRDIAAFLVREYSY